MRKLAIPERRRWRLELLRHAVETHRKLHITVLVVSTGAYSSHFALTSEMLRVHRALDIEPQGCPQLGLCARGVSQLQPA
jgi:hypothetical protein